MCVCRRGKILIPSADITGEEGTGIWSNTESVDEHIPAPTLSTAHFLRLASADRHARRSIQTAFNHKGFPPQKLEGVEDRAAFVEDLRRAVYASCLASYAQGLNIIAKTDADKGWDIDFSAVLQIWRAGCIIQADHIADLLRPILSRDDGRVGRNDSGSGHVTNFLAEGSIAKELSGCKAALQRIVLKAVEADHVVPAISASLEYVKYMTSLDLPTQFYEAELDYFGKHMYDRRDDDKDEAPTEGKHHFEWKKA